MIELEPAVTTFDLPASEAVIELEAPPLSSVFNFLEPITLTRRNGDYLTDDNGRRLVARRLQAIRVNVIDLGA